MKFYRMHSPDDIPGTDNGHDDGVIKRSRLIDMASAGVRMKVSDKTPGSWLVASATWLLIILDGGLFYVSFAAQFAFIYATKHNVSASLIEAATADAALMIVSLLGLGLARQGKSSKTVRALVVVFAGLSALMNFAAVSSGSLRVILVYVAPAIVIAVITDVVISTVRRIWLKADERSIWSAVGKVAGVVALYTLRLVLAPLSTPAGLRRYVLEIAPLPEAPVKATIAPPVIDLQPVAPVAPIAAPVEDKPRKPASHRKTVEAKAAPKAIDAPKPESKKDRLLAMYRSHALYGDKEKAYTVAKELYADAGYASDGTARKVIYDEIRRLEAQAALSALEADQIEAAGLTETPEA
jgi:hypothetical protein